MNIVSPGTEIIVKDIPGLNKNIRNRTGFIIKWHNDNIYTILINQKEYILFDSEFEILKKVI